MVLWAVWMADGGMLLVCFVGLCGLGYDWHVTDDLGSLQEHWLQSIVS